MSTTKNVNFKIKLSSPNASTEITDGIERIFKLASSKDLSISNMHLFNENCTIQKYDDIKSVVRAWAKIRVRAYHDRKKYQITEMEREHAILSAKVRFIAAIIAKEIKILNIGEDILEARLTELEFPKFGADPSYDYLTSMPIRQLTAQRKEAIERELAKLTDELEILRATPIQLIWARELEALETVWDKYYANYIADMESDVCGGNGTSGKKRRSIAKK